MKMLITLIAVLALTAPVFAGDLTLTATDNGDGTLTVGYSGYTGDAPVGLALIVDSTGDGQTQSAVGSVVPCDSFFDVYIDYYNSNPGAINDNTFCDDGAHPAADPAAAGVATLPADVVSLSMGELDELNDAPASGTLAVVDFGGAASGTISGDTLRGCVVDILGNEMTVNGGACGALSLAFTVTDGPVCCRGDVADGLGLPGTNTLVDFGDINLVVGTIAPLGFSTTIVAHPELTCGDVANGLGLPAPIGSHGIIDFGDINYMVGTIAPLGFSTPCPIP